MPYGWDARTRAWVYVTPAGQTYWFVPSDVEGSTLPLPSSVIALIHQAEAGDAAAQEQVSGYFDALNTDEPQEGYGFSAQSRAATPAQAPGETRGVRLTPESINTQTTIDERTLSLVDRKAKLDAREDALRRAYAASPYGEMPQLSYQAPTGGTSTDAGGFPGVAPDAYLDAYNRRDFVAAGGALDARERAITAAEDQYKVRAGTDENLTDYGDTLREARRLEASGEAENAFLRSKTTNDQYLRPRMDASGAWDYQQTAGTFDKATALRERAAKIQAKLWPGEAAAFSVSEEERRRADRDRAGFGGYDRAQPHDPSTGLLRRSMGGPIALPRFAGGGQFQGEGDGMSTWGTIPGIGEANTARQEEYRAGSRMTQEEQTALAELDRQYQQSIEDIKLDVDRSEAGLREEYAQRNLTLDAREARAGVALAQARRGQQLATLSPLAGAVRQG